MKIDSVNLDAIFETSWEVCNKIGGIYTVLSSKALILQNLYKDKTIFIGPDVWDEENPCPYFSEVPSLLMPWKKKANLPYGISVRTGRWNVPGKPIVVLVKFQGVYEIKDYFYGEMWQRYGVDSLHGYGDYDEGCCFALAAGIVIESICNFKRFRHKNVIAHFDEWTTGMGLLYTAWKLPAVATIFTTHATSIGRSICGNGKPLYDYLPGYNGDQMARELNMESKHSLEKAAAHNADCFTTVSDVTAAECEQLLDIRPQVVTPNGFQPEFVPVKGKAKKARSVAREAMLNVGSKMSGQPLGDNTFIIATSGRCEYRNKGIDVFLDAAKKLEQADVKANLLLYILVPAWTGAPKQELKDALAADKYVPVPDPASTHTVQNPGGEDAILGRMHQLGLGANSGSKVQVIYVPCYLNGDDGIFNLTYYDMLAGFDATAFPSYYEPWGYTPLESVAFGVPTVTTSLSGFGQWVRSVNRDSFDTGGVEVIERNDSNYGEVVDRLAQAMLDLVSTSEDRRAAISKAAHETASKAEWDYFVTYYIDAFRVALDNAEKRSSNLK